MNVASAALTRLSIVCLAIFTLTQCKEPAPSKRSLPSSADVQTNCLTGNTALTAPSWQSGISAIFVTNCGSCHPGTQPSNYTLYANVKANIAHVVVKIQSEHRPLTQADKEALSAWVLAGYPENNTVATPSTVASPTPSADPNAPATSNTPTATSCIPAPTAVPSTSPSPSISGSAVETPAVTPTPTI